MNIFITGASGFIGSHIADAMVKDGHKLTVCLRNSQFSRKKWKNVNVIEGDFTKDHDISDWLPRLEGIDILINTVGIIRETGRQTFKALHTDAPCALFSACEIKGVRKVIQISALGADETAFSQYHLTKRVADQYLMGLAMDWSILMPSIVYGQGGKSFAFFKAFSTLPFIPLVDKGDQPIQPIHIDDLVKAVLHLIRDESLKNTRIELVGPEAITMRELYSKLRHWLGFGKARFLSIPYSLTIMLAKAGGFLTDSPMTKETVQMLQKGNTADVTSFINLFGITPISLDDVLRKTQAQEADRWHASLYFIKPLLRLSIAFLWIFTGIVSVFIFPVEDSYSMLQKAGITGVLAPVMLYGAATTDFVLGLATAMSYRIRLIGLIQIAIIIIYSVIITFSQPEMWIHPFGPVSKNIPLIMAILVMLVLEKR